MFRRTASGKRPPRILQFGIWSALFDTTSRAVGGNCRTALVRVTGISPLRGSLRAAPIACGCGWAGVSLSLARVGPAPYSRPQCETAHHRLFCGRMGTALHLPWPSLMQTSSAQMVLAHPPASLQPPSRGPPVSVCIPLPDMRFSRSRLESRRSAVFPVQSKLGQDAVHDLQVLPGQSLAELAQERLLWT